MSTSIGWHTPVRPHVLAQGLCWCRPVWDEGVWIHRYCELRPDVQARMAVYSY